jgi:large subunit ribosomal protein L17
MLNSLIKYEQITTTLPKAKILKPQIDKVITLGKKDSLANKKSLFSKLQDKINTRKVTSVLSKRYLNRRGGYSRIIKTGFRYGDGASLAIIELVDRDVKAKKVDVKKKTKESKSETTPENTKETKK